MNIFYLAFQRKIGSYPRDKNNLLNLTAQLVIEKDIKGSQKGRK